MKLALGLFLAFFTAFGAVFAQSQGPFSPTAFNGNGAGAPWANLGGVHTVDNNPAYVDLAQYPTCNSGMCYYSNEASFSGFAFSVPSTAIITGIKLDVMQRVSSPGGGIRDSILMLAMNGAGVGSDYANPAYWTDTPTLNSYGDSLDTWSYTWYPSSVNDANFGLIYRLTNDSYDQPASVDYLSMTVFYQNGTGISSQTSKPWEIVFSEGSLSISVEASVLSNGYLVEVRDVQGRLFFSDQYGQGQSKLDLSIDASLWSNGVYVVSVLSSEGYATQRKVILSN